MKNRIHLLTLLTVHTLAGATYYVCADTGGTCNASDSNAGTSKTATFLHAPGMTNFTGTYTHAAGDHIILRGGDTWHFGNGAASPYVGVQTIGATQYGWVWPAGWNGASTSNRDYIGVDQTWYNSSVCGASWCRPIMQGDNPTSTSLVASCAYNENNEIIISIKSKQYVQVDNLEFTGFCVNGNSGDAVTMINWATNLTTPGNLISNVYFHGDTMTSGSANPDGINGTTDHTLGGGDTVSGMVCDWSDSYAGGMSCIFGDAWDIHNSVVNGGCEGVIINNGHAFHDNLVENIHACTNGSHPNALENNVEFNATNVAYNNIFTANDNAAGVVNAWFCPNAATPDYHFNNLVYGLTGVGNIWNLANENAPCGNAGKAYVFNNTWVVQSAVAGPSTNSTVWFYNNHCILPSGGTQTTCSSYRGTENYLTNLVQSTSAATAQGYTSSETFVYSPILGGGTISQGTNEQALCSALTGSSDPILQAAGAACQYDTGYACTYNTTSHSVSCPARTELLRPASAAWDIGVYQYQAPASLGGSFFGNSTLQNSSQN